MVSTELKGVGLHYAAFRDAIREDSRQTTPSRGVTPRKSSPSRRTWKVELVPHLRTHPSIQPIQMGQLTYSDRASELFKPPCRDNRDSKASRCSRAGKALEVHVKNDKTAALPERNAAVVEMV